MSVNVETRLTPDGETGERLLVVEFTVDHKLVGRQSIFTGKKFYHRDGGLGFESTYLTRRGEDRYIAFKDKGTQLVRFRESGGPKRYDMTDHSARRLWEGLQIVGFKADSYV